MVVSITTQLLLHQVVQGEAAMVTAAMEKPTLEVVEAVERATREMVALLVELVALVLSAFVLPPLHKRKRSVIK